MFSRSKLKRLEHCSRMLLRLWRCWSTAFAERMQLWSSFACIVSLKCCSSSLKRKSHHRCSCPRCWLCYASERRRASCQDPVTGTGSLTSVRSYRRVRCRRSRKLRQDEIEATCMPKHLNSDPTRLIYSYLFLYIGEWPHRHDIWYVCICLFFLLLWITCIHLSNSSVSVHLRLLASSFSSHLARTRHAWPLYVVLLHRSDRTSLV